MLRATLVTSLLMSCPAHAPATDPAPSSTVEPTPAAPVEAPPVEAPPEAAEPAPASEAPAEPPRCVGTPSRIMAEQDGKDPEAWCEPDKGLIRGVIQGQRSRFKACLRDGLTRVPGLAGKIVVQFAIEPSGRVTGACSPESTVQDPATVDCVLKVFTKLRFPNWRILPKCAAPWVSYPVVFAPDAGE